MNCGIIGAEKWCLERTSVLTILLRKMLKFEAGINAYNMITHNSYISILKIFTVMKVLWNFTYISGYLAMVDIWTQYRVVCHTNEDVITGSDRSCLLHKIVNKSCLTHVKFNILDTKSSYDWIHHCFYQFWDGKNLLIQQ